jgi:tRNA/rRNA methyltransferase
VKTIKPTIVLVRPQLPENIGLTVRAMHNCGLDKLILISPREKWPNQKAIDSSANAKVIINKTKIFDSINEAVANYNFVIATSARKRFLRKPHKKDFVTLFKELPNTKKIAILFGPEQSGLSNEDLMLCDSIFTIPSSNNNHSYNLSHSVLLMSYMWQEHFRNFMFRVSKNNDLSDKKSFNFFMQYLRNELNNSGFLYPKEKSNSMFNNIQSMFLRAELSKREIQTLWGMIKIFQNPKKR